MEPSEMLKVLNSLPVEEAVVVEKKGSLLPVILGLIGLGIVVYVFHQYTKKEEVNDKEEGLKVELILLLLTL